MTGYHGKFVPKWWCWYLVNMANWSKPHVVKRHFQTRQMAKDYHDRYLGNMPLEVSRGYDIIGKDVIVYKSSPNGTTNPHYPIKSKYHFPKWAVDQPSKERARLRMRKKFKKDKRLPELTNKDIFAFLKNRPTKFAKLCSAYKRWHYPFSENKFNLSIYKKSYPWPIQLRTLSIIEKVIVKHNYDCGLWPVTTMVEKVYDRYGDLINKFISENPTNLSLIDKEFKARGFVKTRDFKHNPDLDNYVCSTDGKWIYPKLCWMDKRDQDRVGGYQVYNLQALVGINGYTKAWVKKKLVNTI